MSRYRTTGVLEEGALTDGDAGFLGVNQLNAGPQEVVEARNCRFVTTTEGEECQPRLGVAKLPWTNRVSSGTTTAQPFLNVYGAGEFRDSDDLRWIVFAADGKVWRTREGGGAVELTIPPGELVSYEVSFTQTVNGLVLFRGKDRAPWILATLDVGFVPVALAANTISGAASENLTDGTQAIPNASSGEWIGNRLFIPYESGGAKDLVAISDYLNATRYAPIRSQGRVNQGSSDRLLRLFKYNENQGLAFKEASVYVVTGIKGDLGEMSLDELTKVYGLAGRKAVAPTGKDVWYLAPKVGIASIQLTDAGKFQGIDVPVSALVQRIIDRIDWRNADKATAAYWNNRFYLAVPLDDSKGYGVELVPSGQSYGGSGFFTVGVVPGATYRWVKGGANDVGLDYRTGAQTETGEFVAGLDTVELDGVVGAACAASLKRVYPDVNNAVIVYDFLKQHWAGYDDGPAMMVKDWFKSSYLGAERLFFFSADGFINLVEELYFDEVGKESTTLVSDILSMAGYQTVAVTAGSSYALVGSLVTADLTVVNGLETLTVGDGLTLVPGLGVVGQFAAYTGTIAVVAGAGALTREFRLVKLSYTLDTAFIDMEMLTRGYRCGAEQRKRFQVARPSLRTWYAMWSLSAVTEGMVEETTIKANVTRDVTLYDKPYNRPAYNRTNVNDDHEAPYRQDYAVVLGQATTASGGIVAGLLYFVEDLTGAASITYNGNVVAAPGTFTGVAGVTTFTVTSGTPVVYGPGNYIFAGSNGFEPDEHQEYSRPVKLPAVVRGRQVQLRVRNTQGRCCVLSLGVEGELIDRRMGAFV